jgi:MFS family permease
MPHRNTREVRRRVQREAAAAGVMGTINSAFINPLLVSRGAGALALGVYASGANLLGLGAGFLGPRLAARVGSVSRAILLVLTLARCILIALAMTLIVTGDGAVGLLVGVALCWIACEGLALPLWTAVLTGLASPAERGRWLSLRATAATGAAAVVMLILVVLLRIFSAERALPVAYAVAAFAGVASLIQLRGLVRAVPELPLPPVRSLRSVPAGQPMRRFLAGVACVWFGAGLVGPIMAPYIINDLGAPTAFFGISAVVAAFVGLLVQRRWGRIGDERGARAVLLLGGVGAAFPPILWAMVPIYWAGLLVDTIAAASWPGHVLGLTLRSCELVDDDAERPTMLAWTNLAQGTGAFLAPLVASALVGITGPIPLMVAAGIFRLIGTVVIAEPSFAWLPLRRSKLALTPAADVPPPLPHAGDGDSA